MEEPATLVLNRFVRLGRGRGLDLATGCQVWLHLEALGDPERQRRRAAIAAALSVVRHRSLLPLIDFGIDGRGTWVEAYRAGDAEAVALASGAASPRWSWAAAAVLEAAGFCLGSAGYLCGDLGQTPLAAWAGPTRLLALAEEAEPAPGGGPDRAGRLPILATRLQRREELDELGDILDDDRARGARRLTVHAPRGAGLRSVFELLARDARLRGFVPVSSAVGVRFSAWAAASGAVDLGELLRHRHLLVLDDRRDRHAGPRLPALDPVSAMLVRLGPSDGRPHLVITASDRSDGGAALRLGPLEADVLRRAVVCAGVPAAVVRRAVEDALRVSGGWPGPFMAALATRLGVDGEAYPTRGQTDLRDCVAEDPELAPPSLRPAAPAFLGGSQPSGGQATWLDDPRRRHARGLVARGRHAAAERLLRRTLGAMRRRNQWADAGRAALDLGCLHRERGRLRAAAAAFEECRALCARAEYPLGEVAALLHAGAAQVDDAQFGPAEATLRTALVAAEHAGWRALTGAARAELARCLFWRGLHAEAREFLPHVETPARPGPKPSGVVAEQAAPAEPEVNGAWGQAASWLPPGLAALPVEIAVRSALAGRDPGRAARCLRAEAPPGAPADPHTAVMRRVLGVLIAGARGDAAGAAAELADGLRQVRDAHLPIMAMELRVAFVQGCIEGDDLESATRHLGRLDRLSARVPGLLRLRLDELRSRLQRRAQGIDAAPGEDRVDTTTILSILRRCQDADEDVSAVGGVCEVLRTSLNAAAVTAFLGAPDGVRAVATAGVRPCRADVIERCMASRLAIGPESTRAGIEAAAAIGQGGHVMGGLAVRWPADASPDAARVRGLLAAAAAAVGPPMRALASAGPGADVEEGPIADLSGSSAVMVELRRQVLRAALAPFAVLVQGESGTGKELIARAIHRASSRRARRFCALNCAALSDDLFETELFGHARGAFTGASADRPGLIEDADGGTLFLDEVGELTPRAQAKLLRAIQEGEVRRVGENHARRVDVRIVAAANRALAEDVRAGRFRHDLLFRLDVVRITVPPLRDHAEDIPALAQRFWREALARTGGNAQLAPQTLAALARYAWPGNVRELQNVMAALAVQACQGGRIGPARLPDAVAGRGAAGGEATSLAEARRRFEERFVRATLAVAGGRRSDAAAALGLTRQGLAKLMGRLGIERARHPGEAERAAVAWSGQ